MQHRDKLVQLTPSTFEEDKLFQYYEAILLESKPK